MGEREQVRPLAPVAGRQSSDEGASRHQKKRGRKCCAFTAAIVVILVTAIVAVRFTVFRVKDPIIKMNGVTVSRLELTNGHNSQARIMSNPSLNVDFISGLLSMNAYTRVPGRMKIVVVKRSIVVEMNCSMALNITTQQIQTQECKQNVDY
ncbi:hypothetical protein OIU78_015637 [Salix suchowensis]|nr:hypothetical protein OIU78_015637 [Salix suchowensis]